jgi:hypothetical protein
METEEDKIPIGQKCDIEKKQPENRKISKTPYIVVLSMNN